VISSTISHQKRYKIKRIYIFQVSFVSVNHLKFQIKWIEA
jgi:hypothetical protein